MRSMLSKNSFIKLKKKPINQWDLEILQTWGNQTKSSTSESHQRRKQAEGLRMLLSEVENEMKFMGYIKSVGLWKMH